MAAALAMLMACGSGGGSTNDGSTRQVKLLANTQITPWTSGTLVFHVSPKLSSDEQMRCRIDAGEEIDCAVDEDTGQAAFANLSVGPHELMVATGKPGALEPVKVAWEIVIPDVLVYGATPGGITSALAAARAGRTVILLEASPKIGGMMTGGLAKSDVGGADDKPLGGITHEFFDRTRAQEFATGACSETYSCPIFYDFEPHVAGEIFAKMLAEQARIGLQRSMPIVSVVRDGAKVQAVDTARGQIKAGVFIDASYEGDLMAMAGISHVAGREQRLFASDGAEPGDIEDDAGFGAYAMPYGGLAIDPYVVEGEPQSGLLPFVEPPPQPTPPLGSADDKIMAFNYRLCVTDDPENRVPFARPSDYEPARYEASARVALAMAAKGHPLDELYFNPARTVRSANPQYFKHDLNGGSAFSTDMTLLGWNQAYVAADAAGRDAIARTYRSYISGLLYFWQTDTRFGALNAKMARFGLCRDEFADNGNWPDRLYVRESRRMLGEYVMNENDLLRNGRRPAIADGIAMGGYSMDSHIRRITWTNRSIGGGTPRPVIVTEGFQIVRLPDYRPYPVAYRSLLPRRAEATNLLNAVTLSSTSLAYSSLRMEPTFMVIGQAAGEAAAMAIETGVPVQDVDAKKLQERLRADGQILN